MNTQENKEANILPCLAAEPARTSRSAGGDLCRRPPAGSRGLISGPDPRHHDAARRLRPLVLPQPFRIAVYPRGIARKVNNPYFDLCHAALATRGVSASDDLEVDIEWLEAQAGRVDAVHLHWPEYVWREGFAGTGSAGASRNRDEPAAAAAPSSCGPRADSASSRIWTVHNMEPHEGGYRWDRYGYRLMARESDIIVCHSRASVEIVRRTFRPRGRVIFMPIGASRRRISATPAGC